tara:strand:+ start:18599 stop:19075 length:477 start_codon:yes stop_codon:yes gene_type:complete
VIDAPEDRDQWGRSNDALQRHTNGDVSAVADVDHIQARATAKAFVRLLDDEVAIDRLAKQRHTDAARRARLLDDGYTSDDVDKIESMKRECQIVVFAAMAFCSDTRIENGVVVLEGTWSTNYAARLARFNRIHKSQKFSLAALYVAGILAEKGAEPDA